jgi:hypothetical protein
VDAARRPTIAQTRLLRALKHGDALATDGASIWLASGARITLRTIRTTIAHGWATVPVSAAPLFGEPEVFGTITETGRAVLDRRFQR